MSALAEKIRKARRTVVPSGNNRFTIRRPTHLEILELQESAGGLTIRNALKFVVDWDLQESDLVPGGVGESVPFDPDAFGEWAQDNPKVWPDILKGITVAYQQHMAKLEGDAKNSEAG